MDAAVAQHARQLEQLLRVLLQRRPLLPPAVLQQFVLRRRRLCVHPHVAPPVVAQAHLVRLAVAPLHLPPHRKLRSRRLRPVLRRGRLRPHELHVGGEAIGELAAADLIVEVGAHRVRREDEHLRPLVIEVVVADLDHRRRLARADAVADEQPLDRQVRLA